MLSVGQVLAERYRIDGLLGQGGMGAVYVAVDLNLSLRVAVKENQDTSPGAQKQFYLEASLLGRLSHPHLPRVTDYFFIPGQGQYLVMDYIEGEDVEQMLMRMGKLPEPWVLTWIEQVCDALTYLHQQTPPIIHRDIKPANIKITSSGWAMLVDFGIAKIYDPQLATTMGAKAVTPGYSPPEQYGGSSTDARTDVYALGATLYAALTGQVLPESVQRMTSGVPVIPPRKLNPDISPTVEAAVLRSLEIPADKRFQTAAELRAALRQPPRTVLLPMGSAAASRKPLIIGGLFFIVAFLLAAGFLASQLAGVVPPPTPSATVRSATPTPSATVRSVTPTPTLTPTSTPLPPITPTAAPASAPTAGPQGLIAYEAGPEGDWKIYLADPAAHEVFWPLPNQPRNSGVPAWLPGGQRLAFRSTADGSWQIYTINIDGTDLRQITFGGGNNYEPNYSPDGSQIAFVSDRDGNKEIYRMEQDGNNQQRLTDNSGIDDDPNWSPDGQWIIFESRRGGRMDVYRMRPDGSEVTRLTSGGRSNSTPAWSPDGQWIAFERDDGQATHVWLMDAAGQSLRQVTFDGDWNVRPAWSPDGRELAHNSNRSGADAVWVVTLGEAGALRQISPGEGYDPAWSRP